MHYTNYGNVFIETAEDCPGATSEIPPKKSDEITIAWLHYDLMTNKPYYYTSDYLIFPVFAIRNEIPEADYSKERKRVFSKGQAGLRSSPLAKRYGKGIYANHDGKIALYPLESEEYQDLLTRKEFIHKKAMRNKKCDG